MSWNLWTITRNIDIKSGAQNDPCTETQHRYITYTGKPVVKKSLNKHKHREDHNITKVLGWEKLKYIPLVHSSFDRKSDELSFTHSKNRNFLVSFARFCTMTLVMLRLKRFFQSNHSSAGCRRMMPLWTNKMHKIRLFCSINTKYEAFTN